MALSTEPRPVPGVWGPYFGAVLPGLWLNEGGQSATGALLDHIVALHARRRPRSAATRTRPSSRASPSCARPRARLRRAACTCCPTSTATARRSPIPHALGAISGLTLDASFDALCRLYWRTAVAIALGMRHILDALNAKGYGSTRCTSPAATPGTRC